MDIVKALKIARAAFTASATACKREEYMAECLAAFPFLSGEERAALGREYAAAVREHGVCLGGVKTLPSQTRLLARAALCALRGEEAWRPVASPQMEAILREEAVKAGLLPQDPRAGVLRDLDEQIEKAERDLIWSRTQNEEAALQDLLVDLRALRRHLSTLN